MGLHLQSASLQSHTRQSTQLTHLQSSVRPDFTELFTEHCSHRLCVLPQPRFCSFHSHWSPGQSEARKNSSTLLKKKSSEHQGFNYDFCSHLHPGLESTSSLSTRKCCSWPTACCLLPLLGSDLLLFACQLNSSYTSRFFCKTGKKNKKQKQCTEYIKVPAKKL